MPNTGLDALFSARQNIFKTFQESTISRGCCSRAALQFHVLLCLMALLFLAAPDSSFAHMELESRSTATTAGDRAFLERLENVLARTEKRIHQVFGIDLAGKAVVVRSQESFDLRRTESGPSSAAGKTDVLTINSEVVRNYSTKDLPIACARGLYLMVWPKFRKPFSSDNALVERLYVEGMTAYAAELLYPGPGPGNTQACTAAMEGGSTDNMFRSKRALQKK